MASRKQAKRQRPGSKQPRGTMLGQEMAKKASIKVDQARSKQVSEAGAAGLQAGRRQSWVKLW